MPRGERTSSPSFRELSQTDPDMSSFDPLSNRPTFENTWPLLCDKAPLLFVLESRSYSLENCLLFV